MTAHVAEASESRGRVILRFCCGMPNDLAIEAAMLLARAFRSEVETLFVEDVQIVDFSGFAFAREIPLRGGVPRNVTPEAVRSEFRSAFAAARRYVAAAAARAEVHIYESVVRDEPTQALASACARRGPWNVIALAEPLSAVSFSAVQELFDTVSDATGVLVVGPNVRPVRGPTVVVVENTEHLPGMLRTGQRIAEALESDVVLLLVGADVEALAQMEAEVRLRLADRSDVRIIVPAASYGDSAVVAEAIRRIRAQFLIIQFGGTAIPRDGKLRPLVQALECPVLLVR